MCFVSPMDGNKHIWCFLISLLLSFSIFIFDSNHFYYLVGGVGIFLSCVVEMFAIDDVQLLHLEWNQQPFHRAIIVHNTIFLKSKLGM